MSTDLFWQPPPAQRKSNQLPRALKYILGPRLWGHDGSLCGDPVLVGMELVPFLQGLEAAGSDELRDATRTLIEAIEKYGAVELFIGG